MTILRIIIMSHYGSFLETGLVILSIYSCPSNYVYTSKHLIMLSSSFFNSNPHVFAAHSLIHLFPRPNSIIRPIKEVKHSKC